MVLKTCNSQVAVNPVMNDRCYHSANRAYQIFHASQLEERMSLIPRAVKNACKIRAIFVQLFHLVQLECSEFTSEVSTGANAE